MLYGAVLHSPVAHARISSVDVTAAGKLEGVVAILTAEDLSDLDPYYGHALRDRPVVALGKVRFAASRSPWSRPSRRPPPTPPSRTSTSRTRNSPWRPRWPPPSRHDAPLVHEEPARPGSAHGLGTLPDRDGNVCYRYSFRRGDVGRAFAAAAVVVEGEYTFPAVYQYSMETHTTIAHGTAAS